MTTNHEERTMEERLHTLEESVARLGVAVWTLRGWIQFGKIESHKLEGKRLISESEIRRLIEESRVPANPRVRIRIRRNEEAQIGPSVEDGG